MISPQSLLWEPGQDPGGKTLRSVGSPLYDWVPREFLSLGIVYAELSALPPGQPSLSFPALVPVVPWLLRGCPARLQSSVSYCGGCPSPVTLTDLRTSIFQFVLLFTHR